MVKYRLIKTKRCKTTYHDFAGYDYYNTGKGDTIYDFGTYFKNINRAYKALEKVAKYFDGKNCTCEFEVKDSWDS